LFQTHQLPPDVVQVLREEASTLEFVHLQSSNFGIKADEGRITSPYNMASTPGIGFSSELAQSSKMMSLGESFLGSNITFSSSVFILYDTGGYIGLHTDRPGCEVNALILLAGPPTVVELRPRGADESIHELLELSKRGRGLVEGGSTVPLSQPGDCVFFRSVEIPHQRRPTPEPLLLLSLCYAASIASHAG